MDPTTLLRVPVGEIARGRQQVERRESPRATLDEVARAMAYGLQRPLRWWSGADGLRRWPVPALLQTVDGHGPALRKEDAAGLHARAQELRKRLRRDGFSVAHSAEAFALVREVAGRVLGQRHHPVQLAAGWWLLQGTLVEMGTGEGKTLAATLPAATAAWAGLPVHIITANDYLAGRDAETMAPLFSALGLRCAAARMDDAMALRRAAYGADVVYVSNQVLAFDYLRERAGQGERAGPLHRVVDATFSRNRVEQSGLLRGLAYAIVDEADSVLIDEARTPLILSARLPLSAEQQAGWAESAAAALALAADLQPDRHFRLQPDLRQAQLTPAGRDRVRDLVPRGTHLREAEQAVTQALAARHLYHRDQHYIVSAGQIRIVDETTGRAMPDRNWERGLHQMVQAKEGLELTAPMHTVARLTYQRLYRRYLRLAGMSGTVAEVAGEVAQCYRVPMVVMPPHQVLRRRQLPAQCLPDQAIKWAAVVDEIKRVALGQGRPVLVGTRTVAASQALSSHLRAAGIAHQVLNALHNAEEAAVIASAGQAGRVTVATDMAGRGTDIRLGPGVAQRGGLHVVLTEYAPLRRVDRQLAGRAGRQGDPGTVATIVAADDALFTQHAPVLRRLLRPWLGHASLGRPALALLRLAAQLHSEALGRRARRQAERTDLEQARVLAFSGSGE